MKIAQVLGSYTLGSADILRKAMGKKDPAEMARQREIFMSGALAKAVPEKAASDLFDLMEKFAGYGFNKSHSVAYALIAYQTAWLKAHYPANFMAAVLSSEMKLTDKIMSLVAECREMGLTVLPPSINSGRFRFNRRCIGTHRLRARRNQKPRPGPDRQHGQGARQGGFHKLV